MNKKRAGFFIIILILGIFGIATFVSTKPLGTFFQGKRASSVRTDVSSVVNDGKIALYNHDIRTAKTKFLEAVTADSTNQEAQMLYGITRIVAVYEEGQDKKTPGLDSIREIAELAGFTFSEYGVYATVVQNKPDRLAVTTPKTGDIFNYLKVNVLTELNGAIDNLNKVTSVDFVSAIDPGALKTTGPSYNIDYADVLLIKASLYATKATLELLLAYNLDIYVPQVMYAMDAEPDGLIALKNLILYYPQFLSPKEPARLSSSKDAAINSIDTYVSAIGRVKERVTTTNHLFVLDVPLDQLTNEPIQSNTTQQDGILKTLADVRASLNGVREWQDTFPDKPKEQRTFDLSKFFNSDAPLNFRQMFLAGDGSLFVSDNYVKGIVPYGLTQFFDSTTPEISQSQKGCYFGQSIVLSGSGFSPQNSVTVSMAYSDGTNAPSKVIHTDNMGQFNYVFTVLSTKPEGVYKWRAKDAKTGAQTAYLALPVTRYKKVWEKGSFGMGAGQFYLPTGIAAKTTEVFVADSGNSRVQVLDNAGSYKRMWDGSNGGSYFYNPLGITTGPSGKVYVADSSNSLVQIFDGSGAYQNGIGYSGEFSYPVGVAVNNSGDIFVVDQGYSSVQRFAANLNSVWLSYGDTAGNFIGPNGIALDSKSNVYVTDGGDGRIQKLDKDGNFLKKWPVSLLDGLYIYPAAISTDSADNILVSTGDRRIVKFKSDGTYITEWKSYDPDKGKQMIFGLSADSSDNIYGTTDTSVVKFSPVSWNTLSAAKTGTGSGTVASLPLGINCGTYCSTTFPSDITVTLFAVPDSGSSAAGWTNCDTVAHGACFVRMSSAKSVSAQFSASPKVTWTVTPSVTPSDLSGGTISPATPQTVNEGAVATFTLSPKPGYLVSSVGGTCGGTLAGAKYTTYAVIVDCTVAATFALNPPIISSLAPALGTAGTSVTIKGKYFGATQGSSSVTIGGVPVTSYASWTDTTIKVAVPDGVSAGPLPVLVTTTAGTSAGKTFTVNLPLISSLAPALGTAGTSVTIKGKYFGATQGSSSVTIGGVPVTSYASWTDTTIKVAVPDGVSAGPLPVLVTTTAGTSAGKTFTVNLPLISSLAPALGTAGTSVTIKGKYFGATQGSSSVTIGGVPVTSYASWTDTTIKVAVPTGVTAGAVPVVVTNSVGASAGKTFTVNLPLISSLAPASGKTGTTVTVKGKYFSTIQGPVTFNGIAATVSSWSDTAITCTVPAGATTGPVIVSSPVGPSVGKTFTVKP